MTHVMLVVSIHSVSSSLYSGLVESTPLALIGVKTLVVGKKLETISLSRVGGASLTTNAFNEALAEVKTKAQS